MHLIGKRGQLETVLEPIQPAVQRTERRASTREVADVTLAGLAEQPGGASWSNANWPSCEPIPGVRLSGSGQSAEDEPDIKRPGEKIADADKTLQNLWTLSPGIGTLGGSYDRRAHAVGEARRSRDDSTKRLLGSFF